MFWYQWGLIIGALIAFVLAYRVPRAGMWLGLGAASFVLSTAWVRFGLPHGAAIGAATNLVVCMFLYVYARRRWEMRVWNCFHVMITLDILFLANGISVWIPVFAALVMLLAYERVGGAAMLTAAAISGVAYFAFPEARISVSRYQFIVGLEIANWMAIATIAITGVLDRAGYGRVRLGSIDSGWLGAVHRALYAPRSRATLPWWREVATS